MLSFKVLKLFPPQNSNIILMNENKCARTSMLTGMCSTCSHCGSNNILQLNICIATSRSGMKIELNAVY